MKLYHNPVSTCSQKVRFVMATKNLQWEQVNLNLRKGEQFTKEYLALNPKAVVPTLLHNNSVIRESTVIIEYLDDVFPTPPMKPAAALDRANMRLLLKAFDEEVHPAVGILSYAIVLRHQMNRLYTADELAQHFQKIVDPGRRQRQQGTHAEGLRSAASANAFRSLEGVTRLMERSLEGREWLAGDCFSLLDACAAPYMIRIGNIGLSALWGEHESVTRWLEKVTAQVESLGLDEPWGSDSFHSMVAGYVQGSQAEISAFLDATG